MRKMLILVMTLSVLLLMSLTASARQHWGNDEHYNNDSNWRHTHHRDYEADRQIPFQWHENYNSMRGNHRLERLHDLEWHHRFPGLQAYRWYGHEGFWHHGHYITDAVLFFDRDHELVSVGYMSEGAFIYFREDHESYENHDAFFLSWSHR